MIYEDIISEIRQKNYVEIPSPFTSEELRHTAEAFLAFLRLPQKVKDTFSVMVDPLDRGSHAGYAFKTKKNGDGDNKEYFNYRKVSNSLLKGARELARSEAVERFFQIADEMFEKALPMTKEIIKTIDGHHPGIYEKIFGSTADRLIALRFVAYHVAESGDFLATPHYDRGSITIALGESAPGLRVGIDQDHLLPIHRSGDAAIFMPAYTLNKDTGSDLFPPAWHDVIQAERNVYSPSIARWAIVFFADAPKIKEVSYKETKTVGSRY